MGTRRNSTTGAAARAALREVFSGASMRALLGLTDAGDVRAARVRDVDGGPPVDAQPATQGGQDHDVWVKTVEELSGESAIGRLYVPGNLLYATPREGETCLVVRARGTSGPGLPYVFHGDGGTGYFPSWDLTARQGLYSHGRHLRLESDDHDVELEAGTVKVGAGATKALALDGDNVPLDAAWRTWLQGLAAAASYPTPMPPTDPIGTVSASATKGKGE